MAAQWRHMHEDLYSAVTSNSVQEFTSLISQNVDLLKQKTLGKETVLHLAARHGHRSMIKEICRHDCPLFTEKDVYGYTPLHTAASYGHTEVTGDLIDFARGVSPRGKSKTTADEMLEARTNDGKTALLWAVWNGHLGVVKKLTQAYPDIVLMADNGDWSPLYLASWKGHLKIVVCILSVIVQRNESFHKGPGKATPLHVAIVEEHHDVAEILLQQLPEYAKCINNKGHNPLHLAAERGMLSMVLRLLKSYPSAVYQTDMNGNFPLHMAAHGGHLVIFKEIIRSCPGSWNITNNERRNVLHIAVLANHLDLVEYILKTSEFDQLINAPDISGNRPLHLAVLKNHIWIVFLLLEHPGLTVRLPNNENKSAFDIICSRLQWGIPFSQKAAIWLAIRKAGKYDPSKIGRYVTCNHTENKWMEITKAILVVAALIATGSFASVFRLPGGYERSGSEQGLAHYRNRTLFQIFLLLDAFAMFSSLVTALLVIFSNWTDSLGLSATVPLALKMTSVSFISLCAAFLWAMALTVKFNWVLVPVSVLNAILVCLIVSLFLIDSPAYCYWRIYIVLRRVKRLVIDATCISWQYIKSMCFRK